MKLQEILDRKSYVERKIRESKIWDEQQKYREELKDIEKTLDYYVNIRKGTK